MTKVLKHRVTHKNTYQNALNSICFRKTRNGTLFSTNSLNFSILFASNSFKFVSIYYFVAKLLLFLNVYNSKAALQTKYLWIKTFQSFYTPVLLIGTKLLTIFTRRRSEDKWTRSSQKFRIYWITAATLRFCFLGNIHMGALTPTHTPMASSGATNRRSVYRLAAKKHNSSSNNNRTAKTITR